MKAISKVVLALMIGGLVSFGVGCGQEGLPAGKSPEDVIKEALLNQKEVNKLTYELNINADMKGDVDGNKNELKGTASIKGSTNVDDEETKLMLNVNGKMDADGISNGVNADVELRGNDDGVFVKIGKLELSDKDSQAMIDAMISNYKGKWTLLSFMTPEDADMSGSINVEYSEGDPLFLKDIEYKGTKDVLGLKSYVFSGNIDKEVFMDSMDPSSVAQIEYFLEKGEVKGELYTAVTEKVWTGMTLNLKMNEKDMNGTGSLQILLNPVKADKVETPKKDAEITEEDFAMMFGGGASTTEYSDDTYPSDYDYSDYDSTGTEMTDEEYEQLMKDLEALEAETAQ